MWIKIKKQILKSSVGNIWYSLVWSINHLIATVIKYVIIFCEYTNPEPEYATFYLFFLSSYW